MARNRGHISDLLSHQNIDLPGNYEITLGTLHKFTKSKEPQIYRTICQNYWPAHTLSGRFAHLCMVLTSSVPKHPLKTLQTFRLLHQKGGLTFVIATRQNYPSLRWEDVSLTCLPARFPWSRVKHGRRQQNMLISSLNKLKEAKYAYLELEGGKQIMLLCLLSERGKMWNKIWQYWKSNSSEKSISPHPERPNYNNTRLSTASIVYQFIACLFAKVSLSMLAPIPEWPSLSSDRPNIVFKAVGGLK